MLFSLFGISAEATAKAMASKMNVIFIFKFSWGTSNDWSYHENSSPFILLHRLGSCHLCWLDDDVSETFFNYTIIDEKF